MRKGRKFTEGKSPDERLDNVERTLKHFRNRLHKQVGISIPPVPISEYCDKPDVDGIVLRYMFPSRGNVESGAIKIDRFPEDQKRIEFVVDINTSEEASQKFFDMKDITNVFRVDLNVEAGSRFTLRLKDPSLDVSKIWIAFLYHIEPSKSKLHSMLVENLEKAEE